jgi:regulator of cell morphogenesis and NO signaling
MSLRLDSSSTVGEIVAGDFRTAAVFDRFGVDFCCGGKRTLEEACDARHIDTGTVIAQLEAVADDEPAQELPDSSWSADELARYIVRRHHTYVRGQLPMIADHLTRLVAVHGKQHPELQHVEARFAELAADLRMHMMKEEEILFPYIRALATAAEQGGPSPANMFGTVRNPIRMMEAEHQKAGDELAVIRTLTNGFSMPQDGCTTYRACFEELAAFDADLRQHVHLENNILFPRAVSLETAVGTSPSSPPARQQRA